MHAIDTLNTDAGRFHRGRRIGSVAAPAKTEPTSAIDTLRTYASHEAGYWAAQRHGFAIIAQIEGAVRNRDQWAGRYTARIDGGGDHADIDDCAGQFDRAHVYAMDLAAEAAMGNARRIVVAQGRRDEAARLILAVAPDPG